YMEWSPDGVLRQPTFLRFRTDKRIEECIRQDLPPEPPKPGISLVAAPPKVALSNLKKVFWPDDNLTKGDLLEFYRAISPWLLPYLRDRPVVIVRYPDGINGKNFYQHNAPGFVPSWLRTERMWSESSGREIDHFILDDLESLLYVINLGAIPLHVWASRTESLGQ